MFRHPTQPQDMPIGGRVACLRLLRFSRGGVRIESAGGRLVIGSYVMLFLLATQPVVPADGSSFCALVVEVESSSGGTMQDGEAELADARGVVRARAQIRDGEVQFCDFGFGSHSLTLRQGASMTVTLSGIRLHYGETQRLRVIMNRGSGTGDMMSVGNACRAYLRVSDSRSGNPVAGVRADKSTPPIVSDKFGRLLVLVPWGQRTEFSLVGDGYQRKSFTLGCSRVGEVIEKGVVLRKP